MSRLFLALVLLLPVAAAAQEGPSAEDIVTRMLDSNNMGFDSGQARVRMTIKSAKGSVRERVLSSRSDEKAGLRRSRVEFLEPADVRGTTLLMIEQPGDERDLQYLYLPGLRKTRRIAGNQKNTSFMDSDFTYADMESRDAKGGAKRRLADADAGGQPAYRVEVTPSEPDGEYGKLELWVHKELWLPLRIDFFDRSGRLQKTMLSKRIEKKGDRHLVTKLHMRSTSGSETVLDVESIDLDARFSDADFDKNALGR